MKHQTKLGWIGIFGFFILMSANAFASGPREYRSLREAMRADFYRLTCSDQEDVQTHLFLEISGSRVTDLKMIFIAPARSLQIIEHNPADVAKLAVKKSEDRIRIEGTLPGIYWDEDFSLLAQDIPKKGIRATLTYNDHDGLFIVRNLQCGAVNYIVSP